MKKKNGLTENQKKFKDEYYKNPYICIELYNNLISINPSFLGYSNEIDSGYPKPPEYLVNYQNNFEYLIFLAFLPVDFDQKIPFEV